MRLFSVAPLALLVCLIPGLALTQTTAPSLPPGSGVIAVKDGQQIVFLGDSTTATVQSATSGFIHLVELGLAKQTVTVHTSQLGSDTIRAQELLDIFQQKVVNSGSKPDLLVVSCGLDEVLQGLPQSDIATFQSTMNSLVDAAKSAGIPVLLMTTSIANERGDSTDQQLAPYNDALRALAKTGNCLLADVNAAEKAALPSAPLASTDQKLLATEPALNSHGERVVAAEILRALGFNAAQLADANQAWLDAPNLATVATTETKVKGTVLIKMRQYIAIEAAAKVKNTRIQALLNAMFAANFIDVLRSADGSTGIDALQAATQMPFAQNVSALLRLPSTPSSTSPDSADDDSSPTTNILVKDGQKIAFLGDSITQFGYEHPYGYVNLVTRGLETAGVIAIPIPAGVAGNTSRDMLARLDSSVLQEKPDWMTVSCGVNDVWHGLAGCDLDTFKTNITAIVDQAQKANIQVLLMTVTQIEEQNTPMNAQLAPYNDFLRQLARDRKLPLADVNADEAEVTRNFTPTSPFHGLTVDGIHMNPHGDQVMALSVLKAFGLNNAQLARVQEHWLDERNGAVAEATATLSASMPLSLRDSDKLEQIALTHTQNVSDFLTPIYLQTLIDQAKASPDQKSLAELQKAAQAVFAQKVADLIKNPPPVAK